MRLRQCVIIINKGTWLPCQIIDFMHMFNLGLFILLYGVYTYFNINIIPFLLL